MMRGDFVTIAMQGDFGKPQPALVMQSDQFNEHMTVKRDKVGQAFGRIQADAMVEVERCLAVFLGIVK